MDTPFGRHYAALQELLDFALDEIPEAALTPEMVEAATWFNSWDRTPGRLPSLLTEPPRP